MATTLPGTTGDTQLDSLLASVNTSGGAPSGDTIDKLVSKAAAPPDMSQRKKDEADVTAAGAAEIKEAGREQESLRDFVKNNPYPQVNVQPWTQKPPQANPVKEFGSWASALGILAGALTKTPLASSLNASASAMSAIRKNDLDAYDKAYQAWKDNTDLALKQTEWAAKSYANALDVMKTDFTLGMTKWTTAATLAQDKAAMHLADVETMQRYSDHLLTAVSTGYDIMDKVKAHADELAQTTATMQAFFADHPEYGINPKDPQMAQKAGLWAQVNPKGALELRDALSAQKGHEKALESGKDKVQEFIAERRSEYEATHGAGSYTTDMELADIKAYNQAGAKGAGKPVTLSNLEAQRVEQLTKGDPSKGIAPMSFEDAEAQVVRSRKKAEAEGTAAGKPPTMQQLEAQAVQENIKSSGSVTAALAKVTKDIAQAKAQNKPLTESQLAAQATLQYAKDHNVPIYEAVQAVDRAKRGGETTNQLQASLISAEIAKGGDPIKTAQKYAQAFKGAENLSQVEAALVEDKVAKGEDPVKALQTVTAAIHPQTATARSQYAIAQQVAQANIDAEEARRKSAGEPPMTEQDKAKYTLDAVEDVRKGVGAAGNIANGPMGKTVTALNVAVDHLSALSNLGDALNNGDIQAANRIKNALGAEFGDADITNYKVAADIIGTELQKAVSGGALGVTDREEVRSELSRVQSWDQIQGAIKTFKRLMAGQMRGQWSTYQTNSKRGDFQNYLLPNTQKALGVDQSVPTPPGLADAPDNTIHYGTDPATGMKRGYIKLGPLMLPADMGYVDGGQ